MILAILNLHIALSFGSIQQMVQEMSFEKFQDGRHLGYQNITILAILNLHVTRCLPPNYGITVFKNFIWAGILADITLKS